MTSLPAYGLDALQQHRDGAAKAIAKALQPILPRGFRAKVTLTVEDGRIDPSNIAIELRALQGKP